MFVEPWFVPLVDLVDLFLLLLSLNLGKVTNHDNSLVLVINCCLQKVRNVCVHVVSSGKLADLVTISLLTLIMIWKFEIRVLVASYNGCDLL